MAREKYTRERGSQKRIDKNLEETRGNGKNITIDDVIRFVESPTMTRAQIEEHKRRLKENYPKSKYIIRETHASITFIPRSEGTSLVDSHSTTEACDMDR